MAGVAMRQKMLFSINTPQREKKYTISGVFRPQEGWGQA